MEIFVIGATGYIGSAFAETLLKQGHRVSGLARSAASAEKLAKAGIEPVSGSFEDPENLIAQVSKADCTIDCAYGYNNADDAKKELASKSTHLTPMLKAIQGTGKTFILVSGSGVFWDSGAIVYEESTPLPLDADPVVLARQALEEEVLNAAKSGVRTIVLRPPTVYGRAGSLMIPRFLLDHALKTGESFYIQGSENNLWSAVHIDDLCDLLLLALAKAPGGALYNTGAESGIKAQEIACAISRACGLEGKTVSMPLSQAREIFGHWADWWSINNQLGSTRARQELGWKPSRKSLVADIEQGSYAAVKDGR